MKRVLLVLFFTFSLLSCSSDGDDFDITINASDLTIIPDLGSYYDNGEYSFFICITDHGNYCAGSNKCPNKNYNHKHNINWREFRYVAIDNTGIPYYTVYCGECRSIYYLPSGKPVESGHGNIEMYNVSYNNENKTYRVWK